jgi:nucleoside-diphosphate-sugar epimerase
MKQAVVAGCGYVGQVLARRLLDEKWRVWGVRRQEQKPLGSLYTPVAADLCDGAGLSTKLADAKGACLFYLATADRRDEPGYRRAYVEGLRGAIDAIQPSRVVFGSSTSVYGQTEGQWVDESSATVPLGFSGRVMLEAEELAVAAGGVAVRFGGIYGPGRTRLIDRIREGKAIASLARAQYRSRIHRDDCAAALAYVAALAEPASCYVAVDDEPTDQRDVQSWLCRQLGRRPENLEPQAASPAARTNKRCSNALLRAAGYSFVYSTYRDGYAAMLAASTPLDPSND